MFFQASEKELRIVQLIAMFIVATICTVIAIVSNTVFGIFILTADIVYVILFPQFVCSVFLPFTNTYGAFMGFVVGIILRFGGGEPSLNIPPFIFYPYYDSEYGQLFPYKTFTMICSFLTILLVSFITKELFTRGILPPELEVTKKVLPTYVVTGQNNAAFGDADLGLSESVKIKKIEPRGYEATNLSFECSSTNSQKSGKLDSSEIVS